MTQTEFTIKSWADTELFARTATPDTPPRGTVLISHGYAEHSGRFLHYMKALAADGWRVVAFDHTGHGQSEGMTGLILRMKHWTYEIDNFVDRIRSEHTELPIVVLGQSGGSAATIRYAAAHQDKIDAIVLSSMYLQNGEPVNPALIVSAHILDFIVPMLPVKPFDAQYLCLDPDVVSDYRSDPLVYNGNVRVRTGLELIGSYKPVLAAAAEIKIPALFLHGTGDRIASLEAVRKVFYLYGSEEKELKLYDGLYHELHNEKAGPEIIEYVVGWLDRQFPR